MDKPHVVQRHNILNTIILYKISNILVVKMHLEFSVYASIQRGEVECIDSYLPDIYVQN